MPFGRTRAGPESDRTETAPRAAPQGGPPARRLGEVVAAADPLGSGIGGRSAELDIDGKRVFVERIPLTGTEMRLESARSTANLFGSPMFYRYGVGSAWFGAWREMAVRR